jgi:hypothetical protein
MATEVRIEQVSSICSLGMRPLLMTGFLRQMLMEHFAEKDQIEDRSLQDYLWKSSADSSILIESVTRWKPEEASARPALIIKRGEWRVERKGINDQLMGDMSLDGYSRYSTFMIGSHTIFCISMAGGECEKLAAEVYRHLISFGPYIRQELKLQRFSVAGVGPLSELEEADEHYVVPISVTYAHEEMWTIKPHAPKLKRIVLQTFEP